MNEIIEQIQEELFQKREIEMNKFIRINGFSDIKDLKEKGYDLIIKDSILNSDKNPVNDSFVYSNKLKLQLVKIINIQDIDINIKISY